MHCKGNFKLWSHNTSYCLIDVVTKAGLTVYNDKGVVKINSKSQLSSLFKHTFVSLPSKQFV